MNERFCGNQVCCGTYACLNALQVSNVDVSLFEISVAAAFGIRHDENRNFDRLLTTLHDPNAGLDRALALWGYGVSSLHSASSEEFLTVFQDHCLGNGIFVLGPINMGGLGYQAVPRLTSRMDHYIALDCRSKSEIFYTDSEGIFDCRINLEQLAAWVNIDELPEARGQITLRKITWERPWNKAAILSFCLKTAASQLKAAEEAGQGSAAVYACLDFLSRYPIFQWRLPFLYDLEYLHQRKGLLQFLLAESENMGLLLHGELLPLKEMINRQRALLSEAYLNLRWHNFLDREALSRFGEIEAVLAESLNKLKVPWET